MMDTTVYHWYQIRVKEHLDLTWTAWFDGLKISHEADGATTLLGPVVDQAALYGLIGRARDLGLTLLTVTACDTSENDNGAASTTPDASHTHDVPYPTT